MLKIRPEQSAALRKHCVAEALVESFSGTLLRAARETPSGDVTVADPARNVTRFGFDRQGLVSSVTAPSGRRWTLENDETGKLLGMATPAGLRLGFRYDSNRRMIAAYRDSAPMAQFRYNALEALEEIEHPDRTTTRLGYDESGRQIRSVADRCGAEEQYGYDERGALVSITDGNGHKTEFRRDGGRVTRVDFPGGSFEAYGYGPAGQVSAIASAAGATASIDRDQEGRITAIAYADGRSLRFAYDSSGNLLEAASPEATVRYRYDHCNRVVEENQGGIVVRYGYDPVGNLVRMTYPSGAAITLERDGDGRVAAVTDWAGGVHRFEYGGNDRQAVHRFPNGVTTTTTLSATGRALSINTAAPAAPELFSFRYGYDAEDRVSEFRDSAHGARRYAVDPEGRLLSVLADHAARNETFAYDAGGNRTRANAARVSCDEENRLTSQGDIRCGYDDRGNVVSWEENGARWSFAYNLQNLLTRATGPDGRVVQFCYDAFGRRIEKSGGDARVRFFWAGEHLIGEFGPRGEREFLYLPGEHTPIAARFEGAIYGYHTDALGTPRRMTAPDGTVVWSADYSAFGQAFCRIAHVDNPLRFPGQYFDEETGLHYNRFRYYSPVLGRYLSRDPVGFLAGSNFYVYAGNDPIGSADPLGLWTWSGLAKGVAVAAAAIAVGAAVVAFAPIALPLAIVAAGAAAGAVGGALNEALNGNFCLECLAKAALKGAAIGIVAALPFAFLPAAAGIAAYAATGALSGAMGYVAGLGADYPNAHFDLADFGTAVVLGAATAGAGRYLAEGSLLRPKPEPGTLEPGAVGGNKMLDPIAPVDAPPGWNPKTDALSARDAASFSGTPTPEVLPPGTKIYRIIGSDNNPNGAYWSTKPPPATEAQWRSDYAVTHEMNGDGAYVEHTVGDGGLKVWRGPAASQPAAQPDYILSGGGEQVYVPPNQGLQASTPQPTPWNTGARGWSGAIVGGEAAEAATVGGTSDDH